jgi:RNA polymerase sigma factor (TIGR02999 family)
MVETDRTLSGQRPADDFVSSLYDELRRLASVQLQRERVDHTLQPTALVNEAWLKVAAQPGLEVASREEFLRLASRIMRNLLVDHARGRKAAKRGGDWQRITLGAVVDRHELEFDVLALDDALTELAALSELKAGLVELRFFGGMTESEAARALGISRTEATRQWRLARAWLSYRLRSDVREDGAG